MDITPKAQREIRFEDYLGVAYRNRRLILGTLALGVVIALLKNDLSPPWYKARARIWAQTGNHRLTPALGDFAVPNSERPNSLQTYREIILTRTIVGKAIQELRNEGKYEPLPVHHGKSIAWISGLLGVKQSAETEQGDLTVEAWERLAVEDILENLLTVELSRDADILTIEVKQRTPERSEATANRIAAVFQRFIQEDMQMQMRATETFTAQTAAFYKEQLENAEEALRDFQAANQTIDLDAEGETLIKSVSELDLEKSRLMQRLAGATTRLESLNAKLNEIQPKIVSAEVVTDDPNVIRLRRDLQEYQARLAELRTKYPNYDHPEISRLQARMKEAQEELAREDEKRLSSQTTSINPVYQALEQQAVETLAEIRQLERQLQTLNLKIESYDVIKSDWPEKQLELARLKRAVLLNQELYTALEKTRQEASIVSAAELGNVKILERAEIPTRPISPRKGLNLALGVLTGLTLGVGLTFLKAHIDNTYASLDEAQRDIEYLPAPPVFLCVIPTITASKPHQIPLACHESPQSSVAEAFRLLRTKLRSLDPENPPRTILVASSAPGEGKSVVASNLAITLAQTGKRVLLIDADLRRPVQHAVFTTPGPLYASGQAAEAPEPQGAAPGLSELLRHGTAPVYESAMRETLASNLYLLPSGPIPSNPAELLSAEGMQRLIDFAEREYDYVVVDSPPVGAFADAIILAAMAGVVVYVFDIAQTKKDEFLRGVKDLTQATPKKIAAVCNLAHPYPASGYRRKRLDNRAQADYHRGR
jgi:capsular exopolysaccharide synthesis family protein